MENLHHSYLHINKDVFTPLQTNVKWHMFAYLVVLLKELPPNDKSLQQTLQAYFSGYTIIEAFSDYMKQVYLSGVYLRIRDTVVEFPSFDWLNQVIVCLLDKKELPTNFYVYVENGGFRVALNTSNCVNRFMGLMCMVYFPGMSDVDYSMQILLKKHFNREELEAVYVWNENYHDIKVLINRKHLPPKEWIKALVTNAIGS
jgi:hypothetical protein